jgi:flagellar hook-basal body complex protein FliE
MQTAINTLPAVTSGGAGVGTIPEGLRPTGGPSQATTHFDSLLTDAVGQVSALESQAKTAVDGLMNGSGVDVHQAMIATEKADMAFELALAVRNKAVQAYQSVMGMQFYHHSRSGANVLQEWSGDREIDSW